MRGVAGLRGRDLAFAAALYALAVAARLTLWKTQIYGDEGHMFFTARTFGARAENVFNVGSGASASLAPLFWYRPLSHLPLYPGAATSFTAWRLNHLLLTALIAPATYGILRSLGVRRWLALGASATVATHSILVAYGVLVFHDGLGATALSLALWAHVRNRTFLAAGLFLAAAWVEEIALFALSFLLALDLCRGLRNGTSSLWPLRLSVRQWAYTVAAALSPLMLILSLVIGGVFPGHPGGSGFPLLLDRLFLMPWLIPILALGLLHPASREIAGLAFVYPAFYVTYFLTDHSVQIWWMLTPTFLAVLGAAVTLEGWTLRAATASRGVRVLPKLAAAVVGALVAIQLTVPSTWDAKGSLLMPLSGHDEWNFAEMVRHHHARDQDLPDVIRQLNASQLEHVLLVDLGWFFAYTPFSFIAKTVSLGYTEPPQPESALRTWIQALDQSSATLVYKSDTPFNHAIRDVYADCWLYENEEYLLLSISDCQGRLEALREAYHKRGGNP